MRILHGLAVAFCFMLVGCTVAPKETVQLSEIVDQQIAEMHSSHEKFVRLYYKKLRDDVEAFMENKWIPTFLSNVIEGDPDDPAANGFRRRLDKGYKLAALDWNNVVQVQNIQDPEIQAAVRDAVKVAAEKKQATLGRVLLAFSSQAQKAINEQRRELLDPIDRQEEFVLDELRSGYADLQRSSMAIKGYLSSVVKLTEERDVILEKMGLLDDQRKLVQATIRVSDEAGNALRNVQDSQSAIDQFLAAIGKLKDRSRDDDDNKPKKRATTKPTTQNNGG
jgi:hypothetical protein